MPRAVANRKVKGTPAVLPRLTGKERRADGETAGQVSAVPESEETQENILSEAPGSEAVASIRQLATSLSGRDRAGGKAAAAVENVNGLLSKLSDSSVEIGRLLKGVTSIAQHINLLALNAMIEASRAGEAGKEFAVLASEVKDLAKQAAEATAEIGKKMVAIQFDAKDSTSAMGEIGITVSQMDNLSSTINTRGE